MGAAILFALDQFSAGPEHGQYYLIFLLNTDANMLCRMFDDHKHMDIYLHISGIVLYWKTKNLFVFFSINVWTLVTFTFPPCNQHREAFENVLVEGEYVIQMLL